MAGAIAPHIQTGQVIVESAGTVSDPAIKSDPAIRADLAIKLTSHSRIRLSDPEGFLMSNVVITDIFNALENALENVLENVPGKVDPR